MDVYQISIDAIYAGWCNYQDLLIAALTPLSAEQLAFKPASNMRSIEAIATHMIGARGRWFAPPLGDGDKQLAAFSRWDRGGGPVRTAAEINTGLEFTLNYIHTAITRWTAADWQGTIPGDGSHEPTVISRPWVIWHLIEHDLHHGGEISLTLGMHKLTALDL